MVFSKYLVLYCTYINIGPAFKSMKSNDERKDITWRADLFKKREHNIINKKIMYKIKYLCNKRTKITTNYKFLKDGKSQKYHII